MKNLFIKYIFFLGFLWFILLGIIDTYGCSQTLNSSALTLILNDQSSEYNLSKNIEIFTDPEQKLTIKNITNSPYNHQFIQNQQIIPNLGFTKSAIWIRFTVINQANKTREWLLVISNNLLDKIDLYLPSQTNNEENFTVQHSGRLIPLSGQEIYYYNFVLPLQLAPSKETTIYLCFTSKSLLILPLTLWSRAAFFQNYQISQFIVGIGYGAILMMIGYNFFIFLLLKDKSYLYYILFVSSFIINQAYSDNIIYWFVWLEWSNQFSIEIFHCLTIITGLLFTTSFLEIRQNIPQLYKIISILLIITVIVTLLIPWVDFGIIMVRVLLLAELLILFRAMIVIFGQKIPAIRYFFLAIIGLLFSTITMLISGFDIFKNFQTQYNLLIAKILFVLLLSLALADRLNIMGKELEREARIDGLTGVANRRFFDETLQREWQRSLRYQQYLSLILCDVDYFKLYNDYYGHQQGDICLIKVAQSLNNIVKRGGDLVARYGGEEFGVILPNTNSNGAKKVADLIGREIHKLKITHPKSQVSEYVTISCGICSVIPQHNSSISILIQGADKALYKAKKEGRDRVELFTNNCSS
jgi:diguanylate cyclase (GGDEF)-like protein